MALKRTGWRLGRCSTAATVWQLMCLLCGGVGGEVAIVLACWLVKMAAECLSTGNSLEIEGFQRNLKVLKCYVGFLCS